jgi:hypothetical protein
MEGKTNRGDYDLNSAITFLLVGLGIGSVVAIAFNPKRRIANPKQGVAPEEINSRPRSGLQARRDAEDRAA